MRTDAFTRLQLADPCPEPPIYPEATIVATLHAMIGIDADTREAPNGARQRSATGWNRHRAVLLSVAVVVAIAAGAAITLNLNSGIHPSATPTTSLATPPPRPGSNWRTFTSPTYRIDFQYPPAWHTFPYQWAFSFTSSVIYLSTQQIPNPCKTTHPNGNISTSCGTPAMHLATDGVLIIWTATGFPHAQGDPDVLSGAPGQPTTIAGHAARVLIGAPDSTCNSVGATRAVRAKIARDPQPSYASFDITACLGPSKQAANIRAVRAMLSSIHIGDHGPTPPAGQREWTHAGLAIYTPNDFARNALHCATPIRNTVIIDPGPEASCAFPRPSGITSVEFIDYTPGRPGLEVLPQAKTVVRRLGTVTLTERVGRTRIAQASALPMHVVEIRVPSLAVQILIASPSATLARRLADSLHLVAH